MKKGLIAKIPAVLIACTLAVGSMSICAAADNTAAVTGSAGSQNQGSGPKGFEMGFRMGNLSRMVTDGVIDQATADSIQSYLKQKKTDMQNAVKGMTSDQMKAYFASQPKIDIFANMISNGVISQSTADVIKEAEKSYTGANLLKGARGGLGARMGLNTAKLVTDGVIDQPTADAIQAYMKQKKADTQNAISGMTPDQVKSYFASQPKTDMLTDMVNQGVISQATADAIKTAVQQDRQVNANGKPRNFKLRANTKEWVSNGLINQATADAIDSYLANLDPSTITPPANNSAGQPQTGSGSTASGRPRFDIVQLLVNQGLLTTDQANAINQYIQNKMNAVKSNKSAGTNTGDAFQSRDIWFKGSGNGNGAGNASVNAPL